MSLNILTAGFLKGHTVSTDPVRVLDFSALTPLFFTTFLFLFVFSASAHFSVGCV